MDPEIVILVVNGLVKLTAAVTDLVQKSDLAPADKDALLARIKQARDAVPTDPV